VATFAKVPKPAIVNVVFPMAAIARGSLVYLFPDRLCMASVAIKAFMTSIQLESGSGIVVKLPKRPCVRVMADFTFRPKPLLMNIISLVALVARYCCIREYG